MWAGFCRIGRGRRRVDCIGLPHQTQISGDYEHFVLRVSERALAEKLTAMTGATINEPVRIDPEQNFKHPAAKMLQRYVPLLVPTLSDAVPPFPSWWVRQTEQFLMTLMLCGHRHNYSYLLDEEVPDAGPRQVRLAEEYIEANAERGVTLEELAEVTGVSALACLARSGSSAGILPWNLWRRCVLGVGDGNEDRRNATARPVSARQYLQRG